jgi:hypothetical protein
MQTRDDATPGTTDDDPARLAADLAAALSEYAAIYTEAVRVAADGTSIEELADWTRACFETALETRLIEVDEVAYAAGAPPAIETLVRDLYESEVVFSGVERVAHLLSLPTSTCANGTSLAALLAPDGEIARWCAGVTGGQFAPPVLPPSLIREERDDALPLAFNYPEGAADADRLELADGPVDLGDIFAVRIQGGLGAYREADASARTVPADAHAVAAVAVPIEQLAREFGPALIGLARIAERDDVGLYAPDEAPGVARRIADGLVTLAAARSGEDFATLPRPEPAELEAATAPLERWLADHGVR